MTQAAPHEAPSALEVVQQNTLSNFGWPATRCRSTQRGTGALFSGHHVRCCPAVHLGRYLSLAFAEGASELNFLALLIGGGVSSAMAMFMIEIRVRGGQSSLINRKATCSGWPSFHGHWDAVGHALPCRLAQCIRSTSTSSWRAIQAVRGPLMLKIGGRTEHHPPPTVGTVALVLAQRRLLSRYTGALDLAWAVMVFSPIALLWVGIGTGRTGLARPLVGNSVWPDRVVWPVDAHERPV